MSRVKEVAEHSDVSAATIYRAVESDQLDTVMLGNGTGTLRVTGAKISAYAAFGAQAAHDSLMTVSTPSDR